MANQQHLELLRRSGTSTWNSWRHSNPAILPELQGADLSGADLGGYNLSLANLKDANFHRTNLSACDLIEANLIGANLSNANLSGATLEANLTDAYVRAANFSWTDVSMAALLDLEVQRLLNESYQATGALLSERRDQLDRLDLALMEREQLDHAAFEQLVSDQGDRA